MAWLVAAYALTMLPLAFWWCCCQQGQYCYGACRQDPALPAVRTARITITGITNGNCTACTLINGTYFLNLRSSATSCLASDDSNIGPGTRCTSSVAMAIYPEAGRSRFGVGVSYINADDNYFNLQWSRDLGASPVRCPPVGLQEFPDPPVQIGTATGSLTCTYTGVVVTAEFI